MAPESPESTVAGVAEASNSEHGHPPAAAVVNDHVTGAVIATPEGFFAPETVTVKVVEPANSVVGLNVAVKLVESYATVPGTFVVPGDRKSTRLNSSHGSSSYAVFCL